MRPCRACGTNGEPIGAPDVAGFERLDCVCCGSACFYPTNVNDPDRYVRLYEDDGEDEQFSGKLARIRLELLSRVPRGFLPPPRLQTGDRVILDALTERLPAGTRVLDWGCGGGRLLQALQRRGFDAIGVEVSWELVRALRLSGIAARYVDEVQGHPEDRDFSAVVLAEVLEHLEDPLRELRLLHEQFPNALVAASVPSPRRPNAMRGPRELWDWPPNHLTWFTPQGLRQLFERAGRSCQVLTPPPRGGDKVPSWWNALVGKAPATRIAPPTKEEDGWGYESRERAQGTLGRAVLVPLGVVWAHWAYVQLGRALGSGGARLDARRGYTATSMVALGVAPTAASS